MNQNRISLLLVLGLSAPLVAQTEDPRPQAKPAAAASLWQMQIGGISG